MRWMFIKHSMMSNLYTLHLNIIWSFMPVTFQWNWKNKTVSGILLISNHIYIIAFPNFFYMLITLLWKRGKSILNNVLYVSLTLKYNQSSCYWPHKYNRSTSSYYIGIPFFSVATGDLNIIPVPGQCKKCSILTK